MISNLVFRVGHISRKTGRVLNSLLQEASKSWGLRIWHEWIITQDRSEEINDYIKKLMWPRVAGTQRWRSSWNYGWILSNMPTLRLRPPPNIDGSPCPTLSLTLPMYVDVVNERNLIVITQGAKLKARSWSIISSMHVLIQLCFFM